MHKIIKIVLIVLGVLSAILWYSLPASDMPPSQAIESLPMDLMFKIVFLLLDDAKTEASYDAGIWAEAKPFLSTIENFFNTSWETMKPAQ